MAITEANKAIPEGSAWRAVSRRDASADGEFVFAVRTTGIFCRPSCPAKRPKRENVEFYASPEIAIAAGYRPCKRCNPESAARTLGEKRVRVAAKYLDEHPDESVSLDSLANKVKLSPFHLQREFKRIFGVSPRGYQAASRAGRLRARLDAGDTVSRATYEAGFGSSRGVYESASRTMGMTPGEYRRRGEGVEIRYEIAGSAIGKILVAATKKGICAVNIGGSAAQLERDVRKMFPSAKIKRAGEGDAELSRWLRAAASLAAGDSSRGDKLPIDLVGSPFQLRVWEALQRIPAGATKTYSQIAAEVGSPRAMRAVGSACARNPAALVVPCHRVLRADGDLGGYRWGIKRKKKILAAEQR